MEVTLRATVWTFVALLALTGLTFGLSFAPVGRFAVLTAIGIALVKAFLVALFFMHLIEQRRINWFVAIVVLLFLLLIIGFTAGDVATRFGPGLRPPRGS